MNLLFSARAFGKSIVNRLVGIYAATRAWFGELANPFEIAAQLERSQSTARTPGYGQQPTPMKRSRIPGKARPSGSKLARKAAKGTIGLTHA